jgi:hypothetical protein
MRPCLDGALRKPTSRQRRRQHAAGDIRILRHLELDRRAAFKYVPLDETIRFPRHSVYSYALHRQGTHVRVIHSPLRDARRTHLDEYRLRRKVLRAYRRFGFEQRVVERNARKEGRGEEEVLCCWNRIQSGHVEDHEAAHGAAVW